VRSGHCAVPGAISSGGKGAVAVALTFNNTPLCFATCHLGEATATDRVASVGAITHVAPFNN
jgi:hypothetical protein